MGRPGRARAEGRTAWRGAGGEPSGDPPPSRGRSWGRLPTPRSARSRSTSGTARLLDGGHLLCCHYRMAGAPGPRGTIAKGPRLPYYAQLAAILRKAISDGDWPPGFALPSEADLCSMFGLSRTAVRQALAELSAEGLVHKEKGRGSFVRGPRAGFVVQELRGFFE